MAGAVKDKLRFARQINVSESSAVLQRLPATRRCQSVACPYVNAGVLVLRTDLLRRRDVLHQCIVPWMQLRHRSPIYIGGSQPLILLCFFDAIEPFDDIWNFSSGNK